ncbi:MAG: lytic transglycosylase domain-containing protein [Pseudomonadota bacterium]
MNARRLLTALALLSVAAFALARPRAEPNPDRAWREYAGIADSTLPGYQFPFDTCFRAAALAHDVPYTLLLAVARGESDFEPTARSKADAHGVMQILWPTTARHLGIHRLSELYEPCTNIDAGARYLREMLDRYEGDIHLALAAYNYGPNRIAVGATRIPEGATWYSGYIYRHLDFVLGDTLVTARAGEQLYSELGRSTLVTFGEPYRAAAFVATLEQRAPGLELDWFREGTGAFAVVLVYADRDAFDASAALLARAGYRLPD